jgi:hypothetical protein
MSVLEIKNLSEQSTQMNRVLKDMDTKSQKDIVGGQITTDIQLFDDGSALWITTNDFGWGFTTTYDAFSDFDSGQLLESSYTTTTYRA